METGTVTSKCGMLNDSNIVLKYTEQKWKATLQLSIFCEKVLDKKYLLTV